LDHALKKKKRKDTMKVLVPATLLISFFLSGCGGGNGSTPPPPPTITGNWTGTATSAFVPVTAAIGGNLNQGVANPDGSIAFSGTLFLTNVCFSKTTISGKIAGSAFDFVGANNDGSAWNVTGTINAQYTQVNGAFDLTNGTSCSGDKRSVSLTKQ
jgi:hypothetical protein